MSTVRALRRQAERPGVQRAASTKQFDTILGSLHEHLSQTTKSKIETNKKTAYMKHGGGVGVEMNIYFLLKSIYKRYSSTSGRVDSFRNKPDLTLKKSLLTLNNLLLS